MKQYIKCIYLIWRKGRGESRIKIGIIKKNQTEGVTFRYLEKGLSTAKSIGFNSYPDFPDTEKTYKNNVIEIFGQRLNKSERADIQGYYDYWEIEPACKDDKYCVLAQTQGLLSTDNFEFVAEYYPVKGLRFISEVCGLTCRKLPSGLLAVGDELQWKLDKRNKYDPYAVQLFKGENEIGYVKTIHAKVFYAPSACNLRIQVKSMEQNGHIRRIFIKIYSLA